MAWITPITNWIASNILKPSDLNRIEGNTQDLKDNKMDKAGGTFTGVAVGQNNTSYTTKQLRNITLSTDDPSGGSNGDVWIKYRP